MKTISYSLTAINIHIYYIKYFIEFYIWKDKAKTNQSYYFFYALLLLLLLLYRFVSFYFDDYLFYYFFTLF